MPPPVCAQTVDRRCMGLALRLARLGMGRTHPNPRVGAVAVREGRIVGLGAHLRFGGPHAEALLLQHASAGALRDATLYVTLEPCAHHGKTPPCTEAILSAGVGRLVAALGDPGCEVRGRGFARLREAGLPVTEGVAAGAAARLNAPYLWRLRRKRAFVTLKLATSLDGRLAAADGSSRWITGEAARERVHRWRAGCDAILIGRGTWVADHPRLTARPQRDPLARWRARIPGARSTWPHQPTRILLDSAARVATDEGLDRLAAAPGGPWLVACGKSAPAQRVSRLEAHGVRCWRLPRGRGGSGVDLGALLARIAAEGLCDLLVEGGPTLSGELLRAGLVDRLRLFHAPLLLGGEKLWAGDLGVSAMDEAVRPARVRRCWVGGDLLWDLWLPGAGAELDAWAAAGSDLRVSCSRG